MSTITNSAIERDSKIRVVPELGQIVTEKGVIFDEHYRYEYRNYNRYNFGTNL